MKGKIEITHNFFPQLSPEMRIEADRITEATARGILKYAQEQMAEPKSGKMYGKHQASAPGEAPAIDTSALSNSGDVERLAPGLWAVFFGTPYAPKLEYGTPRIEPRPFLRPSVALYHQPFFDAIRRLVGK